MPTLGHSAFQCRSYEKFDNYGQVTATTDGTTCVRCDWSQYCLVYNVTNAAQFFTANRLFIRLRTKKLQLM
jgi:hypothetical protein